MRRFLYNLASASVIFVVTLGLGTFLIGSVVTVGLFAKQARARRTYHLTVIHGSGSGDYNAGVHVLIKADPPEAGFVFAQWSASPDGISIDGGRITDPEITIVTLDEPLIMTARYQPLPPKKPE